MSGCWNAPHHLSPVGSNPHSNHLITQPGASCNAGSGPKQSVRWAGPGWATLMCCLRAGLMMAPCTAPPSYPRRSTSPTSSSPRMPGPCPHKAGMVACHQQSTAANTLARKYQVSVSAGCLGATIAVRVVCMAFNRWLEERSHGSVQGVSAAVKCWLHGPQMCPALEACVTEYGSCSRLEPCGAGLTPCPTHTYMWASHLAYTPMLNLLCALACRRH